MFRKAYILLLCALFFCFNLHAQLSSNDVWDLQKCLDYAKAHNININSLRLMQQAAEQDVIQAKAARYPNLYASASQSLTHTKPSWNPGSSYGIGSDVTLFSGGFLNYDISQKQPSLQSGGLNVALAEIDITLQITQAYYNIALVQENVVYIKDLAATSEAQVQQGQQRYNAGAIARKDLLQLQAILANDQYNLVAAQNAVRQNELALKQLLQLPAIRPFQIAAPDTVSAQAPVPSLAEVQQNALANRPEITYAGLATRVADVNLAKARVGLRPTISAGGNLNTNYSNNTNCSYSKTLNNNFYQ